MTTEDTKALVQQALKGNNQAVQALLKDPRNHGLDITGCLPARPQQDGIGKTAPWTMAAIDGSLVGATIHDRLVIIRSDGQMTPATINTAKGDPKRSGANNLLVYVTRDKIPAALKAARDAHDAAAKAAYIAGGGKAGKVQATAPVPQVISTTQPVTAPEAATAPTAPTVDTQQGDALAAMVAELARLQALVTAATQQATAPTVDTAPVPQVIKSAAKAPKVVPSK